VISEKKRNLHQILLVLILLHTTVLVRSSHGTNLTDVASAHCRGRAVEVRGIATTQAGQYARGEAMPKFFLRRILFSSLYAANFAVQCEEISGCRGEYDMGQHLEKP